MDRVQEAQRDRVQRLAGRGARRREALGQRLEHAVLAEAGGQGTGDVTRVAGQQHVDAVVDGLFERDRDQRLRLRLGEVLRLHAVEVRADRQHDVGLVPEAPRGLDVRRQADQAGMARGEDTGRAVGRQHRRRQLLGERGDLRRRVARPAADPQQRTLRGVQTLDRRPELGRGQWDQGGHRRAGGHLGAQQVGRDLEVDGACRGRLRGGDRRDRRRRDGLGCQAQVHRLDHRREHLRLPVGLVQDTSIVALSAQARRDVGGDHEDRRA